MFTRRLPKFPDSFQFGVATADHQFEAYIDQFQDVTDVWERATNKTLRGRATDFWERYPEDIALAKSLGCTLFRFSIAWSRVEPTPGNYSEEAFEHYRQLIAAICAAGMEPVVTIVHFTWPLHVEARGGLIAPDFPAIFTAYVTELANRFGKDVRYWIPFNEPTLMTAGYVSFSGKTGYNLPPGLPEGATVNEQLEAVADLMRNVFLAHTAARNVLKKVNPDAQVGCNPHILGLPLWLQKWLDRNVKGLRNRTELIKQGERYATRLLLEKGEVDLVLATLTRTESREQEVAFSDSYFVAGQTLLVKVDSPIKSYLDLTGKPVAVIHTSTAEQTLPSLAPGALRRSLQTYEAALAELEQDHVVAILADNVILQGLISQHPGRFKIVGGLLTKEPYSAAVALGNHDLLDVVNLAIQQYKDSGAWAASYSRYFPDQRVPDLSVGRTQVLSALRGHDAIQEIEQRFGIHNGTMLSKPARSGGLLNQIRRRGYLVVAVKSDVVGLGYRDPNSGQYSGLEIDLAREVARVIFGDPSRVRFHAATTQQRIPLVRSFIRFLDPLLNLYSIFSTWINANWWHLGMAGKLPEFICPAECIGQQDFIGFDFYWGVNNLRPDRIVHVLDAFILGRDLSRAPVWPSAMYNAIKYSADLFPGQPILIVENGCVAEADGVDRAHYLREHLRQVQRAVSDGMKVIGYLYWSITSNREWGAKFTGASDFGLYHVDLDLDPDLKRVATPAAEIYKQIITERDAPES